MKDKVDRPVDLQDTVSHWQEVLDIRFRQFLEQATALNLEEAERHLLVFSSLLTVRLDIQQGHLQTLDDGEPIQLIEADHAILRNLTARTRHSLDRISAADHPRSELINHLNTFTKLMNVLRNHDLRIVDAVYGNIDQVLTKKANLDHADRMNEAMLNAMNPQVH
ncbi:MAG: hypothetical protein AAF402_00870 [Pseudomonadota bacterium]